MKTNDKFNKKHLTSNGSVNEQKQPICGLLLFVLQLWIIEGNI